MEFIAEIGLNHQGNLSLAKEMVDSAAESGATTVKFQTYYPEERVSEGHPIWDILAQCQLTDEEFLALSDHCLEREVLFLSTVFGEKSLKTAVSLGMTRLKIASFSLTDLNLISLALEEKMNLVVSTGASNFHEIVRCSSLMASSSETHVFLHCISQYPVAVEQDLHLINIRKIREATGLDTGFSDHTVGEAAFFWAALAGASVFEKHFTTDNQLDGPDQSFSAGPDVFSAAVANAKRGGAILGTQRDNFYPHESDILPFKNYTEVSAAGL